MERFNKTIRNRRIELGLTQKQIAITILCNVTYISKLENGCNDYPPSEEMVRKIANVLNLDYNQLLFSSGRVNSDILDICHQLAAKYPEFIPFMHKMATNESFAIAILRLIQ